MGYKYFASCHSFRGATCFMPSLGVDETEKSS